MKVVTPLRDTIWALRCVQGWSVPVFIDSGIMVRSHTSGLGCQMSGVMSAPSLQKKRGKIGCVLVLSNLAIHVSLVIQTNIELINTAAGH